MGQRFLCTTEGPAISVSLTPIRDAFSQYLGIVLNEYHPGLFIFPHF